jgi:two-component system, NtrC family, sensor kinase
MPDSYQAPALILTALLLPAFGFLYSRSRDTRTLLWFLGFFFALISMGAKSLHGGMYSWSAVASQTSMQLSTALFLGSLSPLKMRAWRFQVLYVIPYTIPLVAASILLYGVFHGAQVSGPRFFAFPLLLGMSFSVGMMWGTQKGSVPDWLGVSFSGVLGCAAIFVCNLQGPAVALNFAECVNILMTVVLLVFVSRRLSPGVFLSVLGFTAWSLSFLRMLPWVGYHAAFDLTLVRVISMSMVAAALGMIVLALEDELDRNQAARERERRARLQLEAYTNLMLTRRRIQDFDRQASDICEIVAKHSRFEQAALLLEHDGRYRLAGSAGMDEAAIGLLSELAQRIPVAGFLAPDVTPAAAEHTMTRRLDLKPWLAEGDSPIRLDMTTVLAVPMWGRTRAEGALLLKGLRSEGRRKAQETEAPGAEDLLPIEMLVTRLQATRNQTMLFEKLIDAEKYASVGQLASSVTQQLNNPLTVILGYATLLEESESLEEQDRKAVTSIVAEARRIRDTIESLSRVSREHADLPSAISVAELLADIEKLYRTDFLQRAIEFQVSVDPGLPRVLCGAQQLRQAVVHCLQYAIGAVERENPATFHEKPRAIRVEATSEGGLVKISVSHSGQGFLHQERAFDPFVPTEAGNETAGLGLSLCATILSDQNGRASAVNLEPRGAAIILELKAA